MRTSLTICPTCDLLWDQCTCRSPLCSYCGDKHHKSECPHNYPGKVTYYPDNGGIKCTSAKFDGEVRTFLTGATRDTDTNKLDFEGFLNPLVDESFAQFMHKHRVQSDGTLRDADNWQKGIPKNEYMKSLFRHFQHLRLLHRGYEARDEKGNVVTLEDTLNAIRFNTQGYLLEVLKERADGQV